MKGNFHVQFLGEGVAATSPPYPTPGWATTQVYPARGSPVGVFQEPLAVLGILGRDQRFEQPIEVSLNPFAQDEPMITGELIWCGCTTRGSGRKSW